MPPVWAANVRYKATVLIEVFGYALHTLLFTARAKLIAALRVAFTELGKGAHFHWTFVPSSNI
jgi:hypothetical protein